MIIWAHDFYKDVSSFAENFDRKFVDMLAMNVGSD